MTCDATATSLPEWETEGPGVGSIAGRSPRRDSGRDTGDAVVSDGLSGSEPQWMIASGQEVTIGDRVALEFHPDEVGEIVGASENGLPAVRITGGPNIGVLRAGVSPAQILVTVGRRGG